MKVSIIIPIYNAEMYLEECFNCLEKQTYTDVEAIFINDGSTDNSLNKLSELKKESKIPFCIYQNSRNKGVGYSRNHGIRQAKGKYLFFMDVDDLLTYECIETLVSAAQQYGLPDVVVGDIESSTSYYTKGFGGNKYFSSNEEIRRAFFSHVWYEMPWNKLIRSDFIHQHELYFNEDIYYEDTLWSLHIALTAQKMALVPVQTYIYRTPPTQRSVIKSIKVKVDAPIESFHAMYKLSRKSPVNSDAIQWLTETSTGFLVSLLRDKLIPLDVKYKAYASLRNECRMAEVVEAILKSPMPKGVKVMLLYRLMPSRIGYFFLSLFVKIWRN